MTHRVSLGAAENITDRVAAAAFRAIAFVVCTPSTATRTIGQADLGEFVRLGQAATQAAPPPAPVAAAITAAAGRDTDDDRAARTFLGINR